MLDKAARSDIAKKGFFSGSVIGSESHSVPDFYTLIATCKRIMTIDETEILKRVVPDILRHMHEHGHVPDEVYETHGLAPDLDMYGDIVQRDAGIDLEPHQRSKPLFHEA
jgi:hypothetical protein